MKKFGSLFKSTKIDADLKKRSWDAPTKVQISGFEPQRSTIPNRKQKNTSPLIEVRAKGGETRYTDLPIIDSTKVRKNKIVAVERTKERANVELRREMESAPRTITLTNTISSNAAFDLTENHIPTGSPIENAGGRNVRLTTSGRLETRSPKRGAQVQSVANRQASLNVNESYSASESRITLGNRDTGVPGANVTFTPASADRLDKHVAVAAPIAQKRAGLSVYENIDDRRLSSRVKVSESAPAADNPNRIITTTAPAGYTVTPMAKPTTRRAGISVTETSTAKAGAPTYNAQQTPTYATDRVINTSSPAGNTVAPMAKPAARRAGISVTETSTAKAGAPTYNAQGTPTYATDRVINTS
ncbi:MAG: hypothetical protein J6C39_01865, partial [Clostridia bacterium]|nr:hypothetical protein [Clostridia bacterium]